MIGDTNCGKTCFIKKYINGIFDHNEKNTIGAFFYPKKIKIEE